MSQAQQARSGFRLKPGFKNAMPSLLDPLILQPATPNCANEQPSLSQQVPQTTRNALQLPITPLGGPQPQMQLQLDQTQLNQPQQ